MNIKKYPLISVLLITMSVSCYSSEEVVNRLEKMASTFKGNVEKSLPYFKQTGSTAADMKLYKLMTESDRNSDFPVPGSWYKRELFLTSAEYDVRKTDSLVSPYAGDIKFTCGMRGVNRSTKELAQSASYSFENSLGACIGKYAYQKGHWIIKSTVCDRTGKGEWKTPTISDGAINRCSSLLPQSD